MILRAAPLIFPISIIALSFSAGVVYTATGDYRRAVYWFAATVLNLAVTL